VAFGDRREYCFEHSNIDWNWPIRGKLGYQTYVSWVGITAAICAASRAMMLSGKSLFMFLELWQGSRKTIALCILGSSRLWNLLALGKWTMKKELILKASLFKKEKLCIPRRKWRIHFSIAVQGFSKPMGRRVCAKRESVKKGYFNRIYSWCSLKDFLNDYVRSQHTQNPFFAYVSFTVPTIHILLKFRLHQTRYVPAFKILLPEKFHGG